MTNRLLINMQNKIVEINDALKMLNRMKQGEEITVGKIAGCTQMTFSLKENSDVEYQLAVEKLLTERENLEDRVYHMTKNTA